MKQTCGTFVNHSAKREETTSGGIPPVMSFRCSADQFSSRQQGTIGRHFRPTHRETVTTSEQSKTTRSTQCVAKQILCDVRYRRSRPCERRATTA